jgi:DNA-binding MurR/RpiR family transcriptional regulator
MYTERIQEIYSDLSPGYRRVADYLVNNYRDAAFMTAAEVGRASKVDTTLVVRFAQRLGYPGYPELIEEVQERVKEDLRSAYEPSGANNTSVSIFQKSLGEDCRSLEYMRLRTDPATVERAVETLLAARRIFIIGENVSVFLAEATVKRLLTLGFNAYSISSDLMGQAQFAAILQRDDVVVGIGVTELTPSVAVMFRSAHAVGAKTIGIAGSLTNLVAREAEIVLHAPINAIGLWPSMTAETALLSALVQIITLRQGDQSAEWAMRGEFFLRQHMAALREQLPHLQDVLSRFNSPLRNELEPAGGQSTSDAPGSTQ